MDSTSATPAVNFTDPFFARAGRVSASSRLSTRWVCEKARPWTSVSAMRGEAAVISSSSWSCTVTDAAGSSRFTVTRTAFPSVPRATPKAPRPPEACRS